MWCVLAAGLIAAGRAARAEQTRPPDHLAHWLGTERIGPLSVRVVVEHSIRQGLVRGYTTSVRDATGVWRDASGGVLLVGPLPLLHVGAAVQIQGRGRVSGRGHRRYIVVEVFQPHDIELVQPPSQVDVWLFWVRSIALSALTQDPVQAGKNASIAGAIVLGHRDKQWPTITPPFRETGTAHLLAVSGLHLAIVCGMAILIARLFGCSPPVLTMAAIVATMMMLLVADIRTPLARAGIMVLVAATLLGLRWRVSGGTLLALAAITVQLMHPRSILDPSFQLSFAVVAALVWVVPVWNRRVSIAGLRPSKIGLTIRVTTTAWLTATPIAAHHFGQYSVLGVPATIVMLPQVAAVLWLGYVRLLVGSIEPLWLMIGWMLDGVITLLWKSAVILSSVPLSSFQLNPPSWSWVIFVEVSGVVMVTASRWWYRLAAGMALILCWILTTAMGDLHSAT